MFLRYGARLGAARPQGSGVPPIMPAKPRRLGRLVKSLQALVNRLLPARADWTDAQPRQGLTKSRRWALARVPVRQQPSR